MSIPRKAKKSGAGALDDAFGFATRTLDDTQYEYTGAAWVRGTDWLRYNNNFVR